MPKKKQHAMPSISLHPTARHTLPVEWSGSAYGHPEDGADGGMFLDLHCVGMDIVVCFTDFDQFKALQKAVNEAVEEEEANRS
jgi:hypothetical protein